MSVSEPVAADGPRAEWQRVRDWAGARMTAVWRCAVVAVRAGLGPAALFCGVLVVGVGAARGRSGDLGRLLFLAVGCCALVVAAFGLGRANARWSRRQAETWFGVRVPERYRPVRPLERSDRGHWWTGYGYHQRRATAQVSRYVNWAVRDPENWRDQAWLAFNPLAAAVTAGPVVVLAAGGLTAVVAGVAVQLVSYPFASGPAEQALLLGSAAALTGLLLASPALRLHTRLMRRTLDPQDASSRAALVERVQHLTSTRADAVGDQAAELRRIERDLHDGAQARLVAIGMTLGTIEHLMESDAPAARALLAEARQSSQKALQELRDLVRGIHPPVLAERGLGDAVRLLALDSPLPVEVCVDLPDRPPAPVEAAAYFSVCELLTNAAKHSGAGQVWVDILHRAGALRITVTDDGRGGADPARGSGLRGIERRLGTFDGVLALASLPGGPTTVTMELPCASSSPRISTSSGKV
ncbi:sensor histidine kinase [Peterkaempfera griseoplana]|uniref:sensor histidine kinase n=1 Tax=Peterkaempfera griseoplana TaxID=66896 RepID=UPI0006E16EE7|nr:histidine kinase [Peterkaempfera griseoplana]